MRVSYTFLKQWASSGSDEWQQTFPHVGKAHGHRWSYEHMVLYMWEYLIQNIRQRIRPGCPLHEGAADVDKVIELLQQDLLDRNIELGECDTIQSAYDIIKDHMLQSIGMPIACDGLYDDLVGAAATFKLNIVVVFALLLGDSSLPVVGPSLLPKVQKWAWILLGVPVRRHEVEPTIDDLTMELLHLRAQHEYLKRNPTDLEVDDGIVRLRKRSKRVVATDQSARDRENIMCAEHAIRCKIAMKNVAESLRSAANIFQELWPSAMTTHVFADIGNKYSVTKAALLLGDALDSHWTTTIADARGSCIAELHSF